MSEEEKKEYEELKSLLYTGNLSQAGKRKLIEIVEKQQEQLQEKDKIIIEMAKYIKEPYQIYCFKGRMSKLQAIIEYFTKKAREV